MDDKYFSKIGQYATKGFQKRKPSAQMETIGILQELLPESTIKYRTRNLEDTPNKRLKKLLDVTIPSKEREIIQSTDEPKEIASVNYKDSVKKMLQKKQKSKMA